METETKENKGKQQILFVLHTLSVGGAERQLSSVANEMARRGAQVQILLIDAPTVLFDLHPAVRVVCVNQKATAATAENTAPCALFRMKKAPRLSAVEKIRLSWAHLFDKKRAQYLEQEAYLKLSFALPLREYLAQYPDATVISCMTIPNLSTMMALQTLPNRAIFSDRTDPQTEYPPSSPYCRMKRRYYPRAQAAVFQTPQARDYYTFLPETKKYLIPNFIDGAKYPPRYTGQRRHVIVNFCRLQPVKNLPLLFDAFALLHGDAPDYRLEIYGEGAIRASLEQKIREMGMTQWITIHDFDLQIHEKIRDVAMFVSSSDREGISNSMLEAMAIGLPTVCTDCPAGGARMTIRDGENGLLVPVGDCRALYLAMKRLLEEEGLSERLSQNSVHIREELTLDRICGLWETAIEDA